MNDFNGYAVFFFPQALQALGGAIKPYLQGEEGAEHVLCREIDAGGSLIQLTMDGRTTTGHQVDLQLMLPTNMVRMIVSARSDQAFGFGPRVPVVPMDDVAPVIEDEPGPAHGPGQDVGRDLATGTRAGAVKEARGSKAAAKKATARKAAARKAGKAAPKKATPKKERAGKAATKKATKTSAKKSAKKGGAGKRASPRKPAKRS